MIHLSAGTPWRPVRTRGIFFCCGWGYRPCHFWGGSASRTSGRTANQSHHNILARGVQICAVVASLGRSKIDADILPPRGWQPLNFLQRTASYLWDRFCHTASFREHHNEHASCRPLEAGRHSPPSDRL